MSDETIGSFSGPGGAEELWLSTEHGTQCIARVGYEGDDPHERMLDGVDVLLIKLADAGVLPSDPEAFTSQPFEDDQGRGLRLTVTFEVRP